MRTRTWLALALALTGCMKQSSELNEHGRSLENGGDGDGDLTNMDASTDASSVQGDGGDGDSADGDVSSRDAGHDAAPTTCPQVTCAASQPVCAASGACVVCEGENAGACAGTETPVCKTGENRCVECNLNRDCLDPSKSLCDTSTNKCVPCSDSAHCSHINDATVCRDSDQRCVACQPGEPNRLDCNGKICDIVSQELPLCGAANPRSADLCAPCVSDEQCKVGQVCVHMFFNADGEGSNGDEFDVGWFCQRKVGDGVGEVGSCAHVAARPYYDDALVSTADDSAQLAICTLRASTCPAHNQFSNPCGRVGTGAGSYLVKNRFVHANDTEIDPPLPLDEISPDDSVCGLAGKCATKNASTGAYLCTVKCGGTDGSDCPEGFSCSAGLCDI